MPDDTDSEKERRVGDRLESARQLGGQAIKGSLRLAGASTRAVRRRLPESVKVAVRSARRRLPQRLVVAFETEVRQATAAPVAPELMARASTRPEPPDEPCRVWIAPANFAGQGRAWAAALNEHVEGVGARNMAVTGLLRFGTDQEVAPEVYRYPPWQREQETYLRNNYTHLLIEAERPVLGPRYGGTCSDEIVRFRAAGLTLGLISHGSDLRVPSVHAENFRHSPFADAQDPTTKILQARAQQNVKIVREFDGPVFVSTPDLIDYAPEATWCPTVVDLHEWPNDAPVMQRPLPRVVHVPSNGLLKGTAFIDPVLTALADEGRLEYRSLRGISREQLRTEYQHADIVIDQVVMGLYGVASVEALAAGRVVLAFVGDVVRERIRDATGLDVPIVEATPETLREVIEALLADRQQAREHAARGRAYVERVHDGRFSAAVLGALTGGNLRTG